MGRLLQPVDRVHLRGRRFGGVNDSARPRPGSVEEAGFSLRGSDLESDILVTLEEALASNEELLALPGKFGIAVQADREFDLAYMSDVTFSVHTDRILMVLDGASDQAVFFGEMNEAGIA